MKAFFAWFLSLFTSSEPIVTVPKVLGKLTLGDTGEQVLYAQSLLGIPLTGVFDEAMEAAVESFQRVNKLVADGVIGTVQTWPALTKKAVEAKAPTSKPGDVTTLTSHPAAEYMRKYTGKKETDPAFNKWMSSHWYLAKLTSGTIASRTWAWCRLSIVIGAFYTGYQFVPSGMAVDSAKDGVAIEYKVSGAGRDSLVHLQAPNGQNHTCHMNGNCTAKDLTCAGCTFDCFGGNQEDTQKVSTYPVSRIRAIRWQTKKDGTGVPKPGRIVKSINCTSGSSSGESTR